MKCSIASGSISSQKPAFFSLTLQSRSMIHRIVVYRGKKGAWGYSVASTPTHRKYFCPGPTPPRPKEPVVWGTDKKVVYGYRNIQRKGAWGYSVAATVVCGITPHRTPRAVFFTVYGYSSIPTPPRPKSR